MLVPAFSPFLTIFSILSEVNSINLATFNFLSAVAFNLEQSQILSFGKKLMLCGDAS